MEKGCSYTRYGYMNNPLGISEKTTTTEYVLDLIHYSVLLHTLANMYSLSLLITEG